MESGASHGLGGVRSIVKYQSALYISNRGFQCEFTGSYRTLEIRNTGASNIPPANAVFAEAEVSLNDFQSGNQKGLTATLPVQVNIVPGICDTKRQPSSGKGHDES